MIEGAINADAVGLNESVIAQIRDMVGARSDEVPYLLMPVRIETRFMKVDRPIQQQGAYSAAELVGLLKSTRDTVHGLAEESLVAERGKRQRAQWRQAEAALYENLDARRRTLEDAAERIEAHLDACFEARADEADSIRRAARQLETGGARLVTGLQALRSPWQRQRLQDAFGKLQTDRFVPIRKRINAELLPKIQLLGSLQYIDAAEVLQGIGRIDRFLDEVVTNGLPNMEQLRKTRSALYRLLHSLRSDVHGVLRGSDAELQQIRESWAVVDTRLNDFVGQVSQVPVAGAGEKRSRSRTITHINREYRLDLQPLAGGSRRFQVLSNRHFAGSTAACKRIERFLSRLESALTAQTPVPRSRRLRLAVRRALRVIRTSARIGALSRDIAILPAARYTQWKSRYETITPAIGALREELKTLARAGGHQASVAGPLLEQLGKALTILEFATLGQRTDAWDMYDSFYDETRRTVFAVAAEQTRTADELWVRVYPDDIAVHTHEVGLTASEVESGKVFWTETLAAAADRELHKAAWRALCLGHGTGRAAWIARQMQPAGEPEQAGMPRLLETLHTLDRRVRAMVRKTGAAVARPERWGLRIQGVAARALANASRTGWGSAAQCARASEIAILARRSVAAFVRRIERRGAGVRDFAPVLETLQRLESTVGAITAPDPADPAHPLRTTLTFPDVPTRRQAWSETPHTNVMPERFVVIAVRNEEVVHAIAGKPIPQPLPLGLDPSDSKINETDENDNPLIASISWMTHFDAAIEHGMGIEVPLSATDASVGFDQLYVLGVRSDTALQGRVALERLLDNHRYTRRGAGLLPIGTPTNNAESARAGWGSREDPDAAFERERPQAAAFDRQAAAEERADGQWFAEALGIDPGTVQHFQGAGDRDIASALMVNEVLWPATVGDYLEEFFSPLFSLDSLARIRDYALHWVSSRGPLPALRVGQQPYGILPVTALGFFRPRGGDQLPTLPPEGAGALPPDERQRRFEILLRDVLWRARKDWLRASEKVKHAHTPPQDIVDTDPDDEISAAQQHFLDMLGLHASSVSFEYRYALNVARRRAWKGAQFGYGAGARSGASAFLRRFDWVLEDAFGMARQERAFDDGRVHDLLQGIFAVIEEMRIHGVRFLRTARPLEGPITAPAHAEELAEISTASLRRLLNEPRGDEEHDRSLVRLLLRQAVLTAHRNAALDILEIEGLLDEAARAQAGSSDLFMVQTLVAARYRTKWSYLFEPLSSIYGAAGAGEFQQYLLDAPGGEKKLDAYVRERGVGFAHRARHAAVFAGLDRYDALLAGLGELAPEQTQRLVAEHVDLCSHRFDAWQLGLANQRLWELRAQARESPGEETTPGVYLGSYGWLTDLRPHQDRSIVEDLPASLHTVGESVYADAGIDGFIQTASPNHAVAAAMLRGAYLSEVDTPDLENRMAVNLSSRRVRLGLQLLDGVRGGHDLGSLLGYRFERYLHDAHERDGVTLDPWIARLRRAFPTVVSVDGSNAHPEQAEGLVVDGFELLETVYDFLDAAGGERAGAESSLYERLAAGGFGLYPWGLVSEHDDEIIPPRTDPARLDVVVRGIDEMADALDALADLAIAESCYQTIRGNHPRAAAVMAALAEGRAMPWPEIVATPRTGTTVSHRLLLAIEPRDSDTAPPGWGALAMTPCAAAEPTLNYWLGQLLGDPSTIGCRVIGRFNGRVRETFTAADLALQPVDLLEMLGGGITHAETALGALILPRLLPAEIDWAAGNLDALGNDVIIELASPGQGVARSFLDIVPLLSAVRDLLSGARVATADEFRLDEGEIAGGSRPPACDCAELGSRVQGALATLVRLAADLAKLIDPGRRDDDPLPEDPEGFFAEHQPVDLLEYLDPAYTKAIKSLLERATAFAIAGAAPPGRYDVVADDPDREQTKLRAARTLQSRLRVALLGVMRRVVKASLAIAAIAAEPPGDPGGLRGAMREIFGKSFIALPRFALTNGVQVGRGLDSDHLLRHAGPLALDSFLHGASAARKRVADLQQVLVVAEALGARLPPAHVLQLPQVETANGELTEYWLGSDFPDAWEPDGDRLSLVVLDHESINLQGANAGFVIDEWSEVIPNRRETTGVALNYDQPDATAPQCLLLAVTPVVSGHWVWDDLVHTLHDTLELARIRLVEPEHLGDGLWAQLLPALTGEVVPERAGGLGTEGRRVILDFGANNPTPASF